MIKKILIIAGSDSGAGAGIQADLKAASALGVYSSTAITSITAQNTLGVQDVFNLPENIIKDQIQSVLSDIGADVIKTGMLATKGVIQAVSEALERYKNIPLVADPVMVAKGGHKLLADDAIGHLRDKILSKAFLITPNIPEAEVLSGLKISSVEDIKKSAQKICEIIGCNAVLLKGGHLEQEILTDILYEKGRGITLEMSVPKIKTNNTHGTGCTYASAIASLLAKGFDLQSSVKEAHSYLQNAIKNSYSVGAGHNPVNHFWK